MGLIFNTNRYSTTNYGGFQVVSLNPELNSVVNFKLRIAKDYTTISFSYLNSSTGAYRLELHTDYLIHYIEAALVAIKINHKEHLEDVILRFNTSWKNSLKQWQEQSQE